MRKQKAAPTWVAARPPDAARPPVFVAVGGNLGDREANLAAAAAALEGHPLLRVRSLSPVFETDAVGPGPQPAYLNAALEIESRLWPRALLAVMQEIERSLGRDRGPDAVRWGARVIDLDLLFFGDRVLGRDGQDPARLRVPHPRAHERLFVMEPMAALAPTFRHPELDQTMATIARGLREAAGDAEAVRPTTPPPGWRPGGQD